MFNFENEKFPLPKLHDMIIREVQSYQQHVDRDESEGKKVLYTIEGLVILIEFHTYFVILFCLFRQNSQSLSVPCEKIKRCIQRE